MEDPGTGRTVQLLFGSEAFEAGQGDPVVGAVQPAAPGGGFGPGAVYGRHQVTPVGLFGEFDRPSPGTAGGIRGTGADLGAEETDQQLDQPVRRGVLARRRRVVVVRPPLPAAAQSPAQGDSPLPGAALLARYPTAVLAARDATGAPVLARTRPVPADGGFVVDVPADCAAVPGPASLLVHRHDERLNNMHNALVRGELRAADGGLLLVPSGVVEPMGSGRASEAVSVLRTTRRTTARYLRQRGLDRPRVRWQDFRTLARQARRGDGG
ncbi:hypothetical protein [Streptomyces sp. NPDC002599]|uniref:hypothetical protein n=1 Tax=Streptomyces sp. NPDC002599 TaxID=3154421 RepID=UPI00333130BD